MKRTEKLDLEKYVARISLRMKKKARTGEFDGRQNRVNWTYMARCTRTDRRTGCKLIYTRDTGHHSSGWFKNPDYERCRHLSISPLTSGLVGREFNRLQQELWVRAFFGNDLKNVWAESPKSTIGKNMSVWHWRLFCDEHWCAIAPRGEVYSSEFSEKGWRSASQVLKEDGIEVLSSLYPG